jgi:hypothetical protein
MPDEPIYRFSCDHCGRVLKAPLSWAGKRGACPKCQTALIFPAKTRMFSADRAATAALQKLIADDAEPIADSALDHVALLLAQGTCRDFAAAQSTLPGPLSAKNWRRILTRAGQHESLRLQLADHIAGAKDETFLGHPSIDAASDDALAWEIAVRFQDYVRNGTCEPCKSNPTGMTCMYRNFNEYAEVRELGSEETRRWAKLCRQIFGLTPTAAAT